MAARKKSKSDLDWKPPKWSPGESVAVLLYKDGVPYKIIGYEIFDEEKCHCSSKSGYSPIKLKPNMRAKPGELLIVHKGQKGKPIRHKEYNVFKLSDIPKPERKTFVEVFGYAEGIDIIAGAYVESEQEDLNLGMSPIVEEIIEEDD